MKRFQGSCDSRVRREISFSHKQCNKDMVKNCSSFSKRIINSVYGINDLDNQLEYKVCSNIYYKIITKSPTIIEDMPDYSTTTEPWRSTRLNPELSPIKK